MDVSPRQVDEDDLIKAHVHEAPAHVQEPPAYDHEALAHDDEPPASDQEPAAYDQQPPADHHRAWAPGAEAEAEAGRLNRMTSRH